MPSISTGVFSTGAGASGSRTSSHAPAVSLSDLPARAPSTSTPPSSASVATAVRDSPSSRASPASTRIPASPSGTGIDGVVVTLDALGLAAADRIEVETEQRQGNQQDRPADHRRIGHVEHRPPADRQEVDDMPPQRSRRAEEPVDQVAHRAAEDHAEADRPPRRHQPPAHPDDADHHAGGDQREHPRVAGGHRERGAGVAHQRPGDGVADDRHRLAGCQQLHRENLGDDVEHQHHRRDSKQQAQPALLRGLRRLTSGRAGDRIAVGHRLGRSRGFISHSPIIPKSGFGNDFRHGSPRCRHHRWHHRQQQRRPRGQAPHSQRRGPDRGTRRRRRRPDGDGQLAVDTRALGPDPRLGAVGLRERRGRWRGHRAWHRHHGGNGALARADLRRRRRPW